MLCLFSISFQSTNQIQANSNSSSYKLITIYSDSTNKEAMLKDVQDTFDKYGNNIIVEVRDVNEDKTNLLLQTRAAKTVTNYRSYFIGHITYATDGRITCKVDGSKVSGCTSKVTTYGNGVNFVSKTIYNKTKKSAYLYWQVRVGNTIFAYQTPLYD